MKLWHWWIERTWRRVNQRAELDIYIYGTSYMIRRWWGWERIAPKNVVIRHQR